MVSYLRGKRKEKQKMSRSSLDQALWCRGISFFSYQGPSLADRSGLDRLFLAKLGLLLFWRFYVFGTDHNIRSKLLVVSEFDQISRFKDLALLAEGEPNI